MRKKLGEALVSMVSLKSELHLTMNEKISESVSQLDSDFRRRLQDSHASLKTDLL